VCGKLHRGAVRGRELMGQHLFKAVPRPDGVREIKPGFEDLGSVGELVQFERS
jgi:hypothetical protein